MAKLKKLTVSSILEADYLIVFGIRERHSHIVVTAICNKLNSLAFEGQIIDDVLEPVSSGEKKFSFGKREAVQGLINYVSSVFPEGSQIVYAYLFEQAFYLEGEESDAYENMSNELFGSVDEGIMIIDAKNILSL